MTTAVALPAFLSLTIAIVVFFMGARLNKIVPILGSWTIPEAAV
jgi:ESS family glutamate:Na+ symporter